MRRITDHLKLCAEGGLIVLDEIQKFAPGAIELFVSGTLRFCIVLIKNKTLMQYIQA